MAPSEIAALVMSGLTAGFWFLLKNAVNSVNVRLDRLEQSLNRMAETMSAVLVREQNNSAEIERLREHYHRLASDVQIIKVTQEKCKACNSR